MQNILIAYDNGVYDGTLAGGSFVPATYPLSNLQSGVTANRARTTSAAIDNTWFRLKLAEARELRALAFQRHNLTADALVRFRVSQSPFDIDFVAGGARSDDRVAWTGSGGTRVNENGLIVASSAPRYNHHPTAGVCLGVLREPQRTQVATYSEEFDNAIYTKTRCSVTPNAAVAPDGTTTMDKIIEDGSLNSHIVTQTTSSIVPSTTSTVSVFAKAGERSAILLTLNDAASPTDQCSASFNLATGAIGVAAANTGLATGAAAWIEEFPNGVYRCSLAGKPSTGGTQTIGRIFLRPASTGSSIYQGDGVSGLYLWGYNHTASTLPMSYIKTVASQVTRTADVGLVTGTDFSDFFNAEEGTLYTQTSAKNMIAAAVSNEVSLNNAANTNTVGTRTGTGSVQPSVDLFAVDSGSTTWDSPNIDVTEGSIVRMALRYKTNDFAGYVNGAISGTASIAVPAGIDRMSLARGVDFPEHLQRVTYWPIGHSNTDLADITLNGPDAVGYNSDWIDALQMTFHGRVPDDWGQFYNVIHAFDAVEAQYLIVEIDDTANPDTWIEMGGFFVGMTNFQPSKNAAFGLASAHEDLGSTVTSMDGVAFHESGPRRRQEVMTLNDLQPAEGDQFHELQASVGTTMEVLYVRDPDDMATSQRYSFVGYLESLDPLQYPNIALRSGAFKLKEKL